jgi:hypothetical protein
MDRSATSLGRLKGWALKSCLFWAQMALAQKSLDFRAHPFKRPSLWITPLSKYICPSYYILDRIESAKNHLTLMYGLKDDSKVQDNLQACLKT